MPTYTSSAPRQIVYTPAATWGTAGLGQSQNRYSVPVSNCVSSCVRSFMLSYRNLYTSEARTSPECSMREALWPVPAPRVPRHHLSHDDTKWAPQTLGW